MLTNKACPCCGNAHGHSNWKAIHATAARPIRCKSCNEYFHHAGLDAWLTSFILAPTTMVGIAIGLGLKTFLPDEWSQLGFVFGFIVAVSAETTLTLLYVDRQFTLVPGPKYG